MGMNTLILFRNDAMDQLDKEPNAGAKIAQAIRSFIPSKARPSGRALGLGNCVNALDIVSVHHNSHPMIVVNSGNQARPVTYLSAKTSDLEIMAEMLRDHGYAVQGPDEDAPREPCAHTKKDYKERRAD